MADTAPPIETSRLGKSYGSVTVLDGISLSVDRGTMYALLGPNGAGKTTTVRILSTLITPDSGSASVAGHDVVRNPRDVRASIGLTGQYSAVDGGLTGRENLVMMGRLYHLGRRQAQRRAEELLEQFDLGHAAARKAKTYSGGMKRRLDLAASLIAAPPVLFLDEPTTGLDPRSRATMWDIIRSLLHDGVTILLTTQYLEEADQLADRIGVLSGGSLVAEGTATELKAQVGEERLELTFHSESDLVASLTALGGQALRHERLRHGLSVPVSGAKHLKGLLDRVEETGSEIEHITLSRPTLDDVFLTLTGKNAPVPGADRAEAPSE
ncbi:ATP-binding cassette domain-containing protein [Streptomyces kutzneri]|uniref:ATP-binding cassette domain-containing protein n=1 Tax=Streptomyces kutzneri TaxID=3051179 RepID=UPI0028D62F82|nr:ATP-binding cassette domain-containing protein [Streptomyces sp. DSM 40907]